MSGWFVLIVASVLLVTFENFRRLSRGARLIGPQRWFETLSAPTPFRSYVGFGRAGMVFTALFFALLVAVAFGFIPIKTIDPIEF